ncbi:MAG TPA: hypothetical protein VF862_10230 [Gemmatimonadales bacterium]
MAGKLRPSVNWLLAGAPAAILLERGEAAAPLVFLTAALAIVPLAHAIVEATELSVLLVATIASDGRATWFKGIQLLTIYVILAASIYFLPIPAAP